MIVRYPLECSACQSITVLRIGVSNRSREPFRLVCQECGQDISGVFLTDQERFDVLGVTELTGARLAKSEEGARFYHQYHPDFAIDTTTPTFGNGLTVSPFLRRR